VKVWNINKSKSTEKGIGLRQEIKSDSEVRVEYHKQIAAIAAFALRVSKQFLSKNASFEICHR
jgi:hypothetical protein